MGLVYYGKTAYEAFAKAYASRCGVNVRVTDGNSPSVDADGTINLPAMNTFQTPAEFERTCAAIIHEVSHVVCKSHQEFKRHRIS